MNNGFIVIIKLIEVRGGNLIMWVILFGLLVFSTLVIFQTMATGGTYTRPYHDRLEVRRRARRR